MSKKSKKITLTDFMGAGTASSDIPTSSIPTSSDGFGDFRGPARASPWRNDSGPNWADSANDSSWGSDRAPRRDFDDGFSRDSFGADRSSRPERARGGRFGGDRAPRGDDDGFSRDAFGSERASRSDRPPRSDRFGGDRAPRGDDDGFSRDAFGTERASRSDRPPRSDRFGGDRAPRGDDDGFSRDAFGTERASRSDRPPRSDRFGGDRAPRGDDDGFSRDAFGTERATRSDRPPRSDRSDRDRAPRDDGFSRDAFGSADAKEKRATPKAPVEKPAVEVDADGFIKVTGKPAPQEKKRSATKTNVKEVYVSSRFDIGDDEEADEQLRKVTQAVAKVSVQETKPAAQEAPKVEAKKPVAEVKKPVAEVKKEAPKEVKKVEYANALEAALGGVVGTVPLSLMKKNLAALLPLSESQGAGLAAAIAHSASEGEYEVFNVLSLLNKTIGDAYGRKAKAADEDVAAAKTSGQDASRAIMLQVLSIVAQKSGADAVIAIVTDAEGACDYLPSSIVTMPRGSARDAARDAALVKAGLKFLAANQDSEETMSTPAIKVAKALTAGNVVSVAKEVSSQFSSKSDMIAQVVEALYATDSNDKTQFKTLFEKLVEGGVVTFDDISAWKADLDNKSPAKMAALVGTTLWMQNNAPAQEEVEDEDEEEDDYGLGDL